MAHDIIKEFWKNMHFENMTAGFPLGCQNSLRKEIRLICHRNIDSWKQNKHDVDTMLTTFCKNNNY